jgi:hypothetical protein
MMGIGSESAGEGVRVGVGVGEGVGDGVTTMRHDDVSGMTNIAPPCAAGVAVGAGVDMEKTDSNVNVGVLTDSAASGKTSRLAAINAKDIFSRHTDRIPADNLSGNEHRLR